MSVEVSANAQDFTDSGVTFLYQSDASVRGVHPNAGLQASGAPLFVSGSHFVNSTTLRCRVGPHVAEAVYLTSEAVLCFAPSMPTIEPESGLLSHGRVSGAGFTHAAGGALRPTLGAARPHVFVEVANNGVDFTAIARDVRGAPDVPGRALLPEPRHAHGARVPEGRVLRGRREPQLYACPG